MKNIPGRWAWCAFLIVPAFIARADDAAPAPTPAPPATTTLPAAPTPLHSTSVMTQAPQAPLDGVDYSNGDPEVIAERTLEIQAEQRRNASNGTSSLEVEQEQQTVSANNDWMLRDYTARLKEQGMAQSADSDPTTFAQSTLETNSATANPSIDPLQNPSELATPAKTPAQPPTDKQAKTEISVTDMAASESPTSLQPLLPPLDAAPLKTPIRDPWGGGDTIAAKDVDIVLPSPSSSETSRPDSSLDFPGLTAAQSGLGGSTLGDASLQDPLPEESEQQRKLDNQNTFLAPTAPTSDVSSFFKRQAESLRAPNAPTVAQAPNAPTIVVQAPRPEEPTAKPQVSGLRSHVDDPFDILRK